MVWAFQDSCLGGWGYVSEGKVPGRESEGRLERAGGRDLGLEELESEVGEAQKWQSGAGLETRDKSAADPRISGWSDPSAAAPPPPRSAGAPETPGALLGVGRGPAPPP